MADREGLHVSQVLHYLAKAPTTKLRRLAVSYGVLEDFSLFRSIIHQTQRHLRASTSRESAVNCCS